MEAKKVLDRLRDVTQKYSLHRSFSKGQTVTIPPSPVPVTIRVNRGKAHLSFPVGVAVEWEGKKAK